MLRRSLVVGVGVALLIAAGAPSPSTAQSDSLPDLEVNTVILKDPPTPIVSPGEEFSYVVVVSNEGSDMPAGTMAKVLDQLPSKVDVVRWEEGARAKEPHFLGVQCTYSAPNLTCAPPDPLVAGDLYFVRIVVQVQSDANGGLVNHAFADPFDEVVESVENNNHDKVKAKIQ